MPRRLESVPGRIRAMGRIHHVALVVRDIEPALGLLARHAGPAGSRRSCRSRRIGVNIAFLTVGESKVELVAADRRHDRRRAVPRVARARGSTTSASRSRTSPSRSCASRSTASSSSTRHRDAAPRARSRSSTPGAATASLVELIEAPGGPAWEALGSTRENLVQAAQVRTGG